jgi:hypothetical protein
VGDHNTVPLAKTLNNIYLDLSKMPTATMDSDSHVKAVMQAALQFSSDLNSTERCKSFPGKYSQIGNVTVTTCLKIALNKLDDLCNNEIDLSRLVTYSGIVTGNNEMLHFITYKTRLLHYIFFITSLVHLVADVMSKILFVYKYINPKCSKGAQPLLCLLLSKFPGSYISRNFMVFSYSLVLIYYFTIKSAFISLSHPSELPNI